jgi:hypothetical protein
VTKSTVGKILGEYLNEPQGCTNVGIAALTSLGVQTIGPIATLSVLSGYCCSVLSILSQQADPEEMEVLIDALLAEFRDAVDLPDSDGGKEPPTDGEDSSSGGDLPN